MRAMKITFCMVLVLSLAFSMAGCFSSAKPKVDKDGNVIIKDKDSDGNDVVIGGKKWSKSEMHGLEAPKANLETSITSEDGTVYAFNGMKEKDAKDYIEKIKAAGFTFNSVTIEDYTYYGTNKDGLIISFAYDKETGSGSIVSGKGEAPSEDDDDGGAVLGGSDKKWDSKKMGGLPDPGVEVIMYWTVDGDTNYNLEVIPSFKNYVEKIKACGFTEDIDETEFNDMYIFAASNSKGDRVTFSVTTDMSTIIFEKGD